MNLGRAYAAQFVPGLREYLESLPPPRAPSDRWEAVTSTSLPPAPQVETLMWMKYEGAERREAVRGAPAVERATRRIWDLVSPAHLEVDRLQFLRLFVCVSRALDLQEEPYDVEEALEEAHDLWLALRDADGLVSAACVQEVLFDVADAWCDVSTPPLLATFLEALHAALACRRGRRFLVLRALGQVLPQRQLLPLVERSLHALPQAFYRAPAAAEPPITLRWEGPDRELFAVLDDFCVRHPARPLQPGPSSGDGEDPGRTDLQTASTTAPPPLPHVPRVRRLDQPDFDLEPHAPSQEDVYAWMHPEVGEVVRRVTRRRRAAQSKPPLVTQLVQFEPTMQPLTSPVRRRRARPHPAGIRPKVGLPPAQRPRQIADFLPTGSRRPSRGLAPLSRARSLPAEAAEWEPQRAPVRSSLVSRAGPFREAKPCRVEFKEERRRPPCTFLPASSPLSAAGSPNHLRHEQRRGKLGCGTMQPPEGPPLTLL